MDTEQAWKTLAGVSGNVCVLPMCGSRERLWNLLVRGSFNPDNSPAGHLPQVLLFPFIGLQTEAQKTLSGRAGQWQGQDENPRPESRFRVALVQELGPRRPGACSRGGWTCTGIIILDWPPVRVRTIVRVCPWLCLRSGR